MCGRGQQEALIAVHIVIVRKMTETEKSSVCESYSYLPRCGLSCMNNEGPHCSGNRNTTVEEARILPNYREKVGSTARSAVEPVL